MASRKKTSTTKRRKTKKSTASKKRSNVHYVKGKNGGLGHWEYNNNSGYPPGTKAPPPKGHKRKNGTSKSQAGLTQIKQTKKGNKKCYKFCI
jgi:hypothetical protein